MAKRTKKVGITGKYGTRYGASLRKIIKRYEIQQRARYMCSFCGKDNVKRVAGGIWKCKGKTCGKTEGWQGSSSKVVLRTEEAEKQRHDAYSRVLEWENVKRVAGGIWKCKGKTCGKTDGIMAGGCWTLSTGPAATVRATIARLRKQQQGAAQEEKEKAAAQQAEQEEAIKEAKAAKEEAEADAASMESRGDLKENRYLKYGLALATLVAWGSVVGLLYSRYKHQELHDHHLNMIVRLNSDKMEWQEALNEALGRQSMHSESGRLREPLLNTECQEDPLPPSPNKGG
eukprot:s1324_g2.t1